MNRRPIPQSEATNAYDLISDLIRVIEEEPQRLSMRQWITAFDVTGPITVEYNGDEWHRQRTTLEPACGTVACAAGWMVTLKRKMLEDANLIAPLYAAATFNAEAIVRKWLLVGAFGVIKQDLTDVFFNYPDDHRPVEPGTPRYVAYVTCNLRNFQAKWASELKAIKYEEAK